MKKIKTFHIRIGQFYAKIGYLKILFPPFPLYPRGLNFQYKVKLGQKSKSGAPFFEIFFHFENIALWKLRKWTLSFMPEFSPFYRTRLLNCLKTEKLCYNFTF